MEEDWRCNWTRFSSKCAFYCQEKSDAAADVTFIVGPEEQEVKAFKLFLAVSSPVFETMFSEAGSSARGQNEPIKLPHIEATIFQKFLQLLCFDEDMIEEDLYKITIKDVVKLYLLSKEYLVNGFKNTCEAFIRQNIRGDKVLEVYEHTRGKDVGKLEEEAFNFLYWNLEEVLEQPYFLTITKEFLLTILTRDDMGIDELKLFTAVYRWGNCPVVRENDSVLFEDEENKRRMMRECLSEIRLPLLSNHDLTTNFPQYTPIHSRDPEMPVLERQVDHPVPVTQCLVEPVPLVVVTNEVDDSLASTPDRWKDFDDHISIQTIDGQVIYKCTVCNRSLTRRDNARRHVGRVHFNDLESCQKCGRKFFSKNSLTIHLSQCTGTVHHPIGKPAQSPQKSQQKENRKVTLSFLPKKNKKVRFADDVTVSSSPSSSNGLNLKKSLGKIRPRPSEPCRSILIRNPCVNFDLKKALNVRVNVEKLTVPFQDSPNQLHTSQVVNSDPLTSESSSHILQKSDDTTLVPVQLSRVKVEPVNSEKDYTEISLTEESGETQSLPSPQGFKFPLKPTAIKQENFQLVLEPEWSTPAVLPVRDSNTTILHVMPGSKGHVTAPSPMNVFSKIRTVSEEENYGRKILRYDCTCCDQNFEKLSLAMNHVRQEHLRESI